MTFQRIVASVFAMAISILLVQSCKDMGDVLPPPSIVLGQSSAIMAVGDSITTSITGGTPPYRISAVGDASKVVASAVGTNLKLRALAAGSTTVVVGDNGSPSQTASFGVTIVLLSVGQNNFSLFTGDSASTTLSGGTPPYSFTSKGDTTKVAPSISGSTLTLRARAAGNSTIIIGDNGSPRLTVSVNANVAIPILFSGQVQPIFTNRCVNQGCHPGGNAPFPLQAGVSFGRLVNVPATKSPCAGILRVKPGDAANSALYRRLEGTCGDRMPLGLSPLPQTERDLIRDWINQGARNN